MGFTYDIVFNRLTLQYTFYLLPFILIYKLYRDILHLYWSRSYFEDYDCGLYCLLYHESLAKAEEEGITIEDLEAYIQRDFKPVPIII